MPQSITHGSQFGDVVSPALPRLPFDPERLGDGPEREVLRLRLLVDLLGEALDLTDDPTGGPAASATALRFVRVDVKSDGIRWNHKVRSR
jgi:hypothetical protein